MRASEKEVEQLERKAREEAGLPVDAAEGEELPPIKLPSFKEMQRMLRSRKQQEKEVKKQELEQNVEGLESQMKAIQERLKLLSKDNAMSEELKENKAQEPKEIKARNNGPSKKRPRPLEDTIQEDIKAKEIPEIDESKGANGPDGEFVAFPEYDGKEPPKEPKKAFTKFCVANRKEVKASLDAADRKNKVRITLEIVFFLIFFLCTI